MDCMSFEVLESLYRDEADAVGLVELPSDFISYVKAYFKDLHYAIKDEVDYRRADVLRDERRSAIIIYEGLMELRKRKIVESALTNSDLCLDYLLPYEEGFYEAMCYELEVYSRKTCGIIRGVND